MLILCLFFFHERSGGIALIQRSAEILDLLLFLLRVVIRAVEKFLLGSDLVLQGFDLIRAVLDTLFISRAFHDHLSLKGRDLGCEVVDPVLLLFLFTGQRLDTLLKTGEFPLGKIRVLLLETFDFLLATLGRSEELSDLLLFLRHGILQFITADGKLSACVLRLGKSFLQLFMQIVLLRDLIAVLLRKSVHFLAQAFDLLLVGVLNLVEVLHIGDLRDNFIAHLVDLSVQGIRPLLEDSVDTLKPLEGLVKSSLFRGVFRIQAVYVTHDRLFVEPKNGRAEGILSIRRHVQHGTPHNRAVCWYIVFSVI